LAFTVVANLKVFKYNEYKKVVHYAEGRNGPLLEKKFRAVLRISFGISQRLVERACEAGANASILQRRALADQELEYADKDLLEEMFPHGATNTSLWAVGADACWPTPGYTSAHGTVHKVDIATGCIIAVAHVTKAGKSGDEKDALDECPAFVVTRHPGTSGDMDQVGTKICAEWLTRKFPNDAKYIVDLHFEEAFASEMLDPNGDEGVDTVDDENDGY